MTTFKGLNYAIRNKIKYGSGGSIPPNPLFFWYYLYDRVFWIEFPAKVAEFEIIIFPFMILLRSRKDDEFLPHRITCDPYNGELDASWVDYKSTLFFENTIGIDDVE
jgi:hypothetical protein